MIEAFAKLFAAWLCVCDVLPYVYYGIGSIVVVVAAIVAIWLAGCWPCIKYVYYLAISLMRAYT